MQRTLLQLISTHAPAGGATVPRRRRLSHHADFYSRPCGRGDYSQTSCFFRGNISTHAPAGGATRRRMRRNEHQDRFLLTPLREGRHLAERHPYRREDISTHAPAGGATRRPRRWTAPYRNFYSRPCGRGDETASSDAEKERLFLLTPLREGRQCTRSSSTRSLRNFYSRPCGRGDWTARWTERTYLISTHAPAGGATKPPLPFLLRHSRFLLTPLREGRQTAEVCFISAKQISTHAPAGGATAIFHKSVMRFCGKLPKDDTVLCLASFGFPRRDPKAVYLAWISCANLPQKCVRQGLALKDQGTSCFHEGLASHAFDPVLV